MPKDPRHPSPGSIRASLTRAARAKPGGDARALVKEAVTAFGRAASHGRDPATVERLIAEATELGRATIESDGTAARLAAADRLADAYSAVYHAAVSGSADPAVLGRGGVLPLAPLGRGNPSLTRALDIWAAGGRIFEPLIDIEIPGAPPRPCSPRPIRVTVRKPGVLPGLGEDGLDPDFVQYLRETDQLQFRSFAAWREREGLQGDPTDAQRAAYEVALAGAYRRYEEERFADRYCRPSDIAAPGVQHGHRLLRLPVRIGLGDFRDAGCGPRIYEGELGAPLAPELDYEELVRRYVNLLKPEARWRADVNAVTRADIVESHLRNLGTADLPAVLQLMVVATQTALQRRTMATFIDIFEGISRRGENFSDWLLGPEAVEIRDAISAAWRVLVPAAATGTPAQPVVPVPNALSPAQFNGELTALCVPEGPVNPAEQRIPGLNAGAFLEDNPARSPEEIRDEIARILGLYDAVWTQAAQFLGPAGLNDARDEIRLSGLEARSHIALLALSAAISSLGPYTNAGVPAANAREILNWLAQTPVPIRYADVAGNLPTRANTAPINIGGELFHIKDFWNNAAQLHDPAYEAIALITDSYAAALDVVISLSGANGLPAATTPPPSATPDPYRVQPSELPILLQRWTALFASLLIEQRMKRVVVDDSLLVLRLVPRKGRYGETPQRTPGEELQPEPKDLAWPGHPTRATEGYVLEPLPRRYFMHHFPALYIREDYRIALMSRGYGIGANLYSMSLLPEEEQTIIVKSFKDTRSKVSESTAENVFEEAGSETSNDFANEMARENQQETSNESQFNVNAKASASFLFGSAELSTGYSAKDSARDFSKNTSNVTSKLAQKLSSKRTVAVETKREGEREEGTRSEVSTERKVRNPNMGHTVTFHWFQMTRKFLQELTIEDAKLAYTSGKHNVLRILSATGAVPAEALALPAVQTAELPFVLGSLPPDVARRLPPGAAVIIVGEPYTEAISMAGANAFLARVFRTERAVELNSLVWQHLGYFDAAPEGLGVLAFPGHRRNDPGANRFVPLFNPNPGQLGDAANPLHVVADEIVVRSDAFADEDFFLPNLDLRFRVRDGLPPARYSAPPYDPYSLPRLMSAEERIVNTNGVFCEAMVGRCTALEDYLQRHRDLDLLDKRIQIGLQEIEFHWALTKDGLVQVTEDRDRTITAVVRPGPDAFAERLALERERQTEQQALALRKQEAETEIIETRVYELERRVDLMGTPPEVRIDAPDGATVNVQADIDLRSENEPPAGGVVTVE